MAKSSKRSPLESRKKNNSSGPEQPEMEPLSRTQLLAAMAATAIILLIVARTWLFFEPVQLPMNLVWQDAGIGLCLGLAISMVSGASYKLWPAYRKSADFYLAFVLAPLTVLDSIWVGLLPGMSEELLFRGVMLPAIGINTTGLMVSSLCFGVLHMSGQKQWPYAVWATAIGLVLGASAIATQNLLVPVVAHVVTNTLSSLIWQCQQHAKQPLL